MKLLFFLKIIFVLLFSIGSFAGGWSSGGGELLKDIRNPWFLNNIKDVSYCVIADEQNFGLSKPALEEIVSKALGFWKNEFKQALPPSPSLFGPIKIASQEFHKVDCSAQVDVTFQFGHLNEEQKKFLKNPSEYAAISVRTSYSNKDMRGKGFVYVSPAGGPLAYNPEGVVKNAWVKNRDLLYLTLLHELGHVFGLPHLGSYGDLMSEGFVESILAGANTSDSFFEVSNFFSLPTKSSVICPKEPLLNIWSGFFGMDSASKCLQFVFIHNNDNQLFGSSKMFVLASSSASGSQKKISEVVLSMNRFNPTFLNLIWLPAGQEVFSKEGLLKSGLRDALGISMMTVSKNGSFSIHNKSKRSLSVRFEQGKQSFSIDGVDAQGSIIPLL